MRKIYDPIVKDFTHLLHGGDYNPEQWIDTPEIWDEDMRMMKKAYVNTATVGVFSWAMLEPSEGVYNFEWLDRVMDNIHKNASVAILATPSAARPRWLAEKYPEVLRVDERGRRNLFGGRHNHCYSSPVYREKVVKINTLLAERYKKHPALGLWHVSNELSGECHCELCQENFRTWMKRKYNNDLRLLNHEWWATFWSHNITDWSQLHSPGLSGGSALNAHQLDWKRFVTDMTIDFLECEIKPLRDITPDIKLTANLMANFSPLNYQRLCKHIDVVSWDSYPRFKGEATDSDIFMAAAFNHDCMRSFKNGQPFLLMESTPSMTNWMTVSTHKRPNQHLLSSMQAVAHGSDSVQYFQWRKGRGGAEKYHGAVIDHVGHENTRVFRDVTEVGEYLTKLDGIVGGYVDAQVAIIFDWENWWALNGMQALRNDKKDYLDTALKHYKAFWEKGIQTDIISADDDFSKYKLVCAPVLYMTAQSTIDKLAEYVENGGTFVGTYWSGVVNENDKCWLGGTPGGKLSDVFGIWAEEIDSLRDDKKVIIVAKQESLFTKRIYNAELYCELSHLRTAEALAVYGTEFYKDMPAATVNKYGKGTCYYMACLGEQDFISDLYSGIITKHGLNNPLAKPLPKNINVQRRYGKDNEYIFIFNISPEEAELDLPAGLTDAYTGKALDEKLKLQAFGTVIAVRKY